MSCAANSRRALMGAVKNAVSQLGSQAAYYTGSARGRSRLAQVTRWGVGSGLLGGALSGAALYLRHRHRPQPEIGPGGVPYEVGRFDLQAAADLTATFSGTRAPAGSLLGAVGLIRPLAKRGGEDDLFAAEGTCGLVTFTWPDGPQGPARIEGVIPARGRANDLRAALAGCLDQAAVCRSTRRPDNQETKDVVYQKC